VLYHLHELQRRLINPMSVWAQATSELFSSPYSPLAYTPMSRRLAAGYDLLHRLGKRYEKPEFGLSPTVVNRTPVPITEEIDLEKPFCRLLHFRREFTGKLARRAADPRVLIVAPLSGHHATLLRDTVRALLPEHDVWITDWTDARLVPVSRGPFHLDDYVAYVREFITFLGPSVHVISVCQPTVPVLAAISLMASDNDPHLPRSMTMMGGPIDTRRSPTAVNTFALHRPLSWFESKVIQRVPMRYPGFMRRVYPGFLQFAGFVAMNPDRHMESHLQYYQHLVAGDGESADAHRRFYDEYNAVMDLPAEYYLETVDRVFQRHQLPQGELVVAGRRVRPEAVRGTALFTIEGELDDISGNGQTEAAHGLMRGLPAKDKQHFEARAVGHYGIFSGRKYRELIYPRVRDFIAKHDR
jgi:poly(3-hydroxybutyrate) depolymerase